LSFYTRVKGSAEKTLNIWQLKKEIHLRRLFASRSTLTTSITHGHIYIGFHGTRHVAIDNI